MFDKYITNNLGVKTQNCDFDLIKAFNNDNRECQKKLPKLTKKDLQPPD